MKIGTWLLIGFLLGIVVLTVGVWSWPSYQNHQKVKSGLRAAELGAQLAFLENTYHERTGSFTADFSKLEPLAQTPLPCPLTDTVYRCQGFEFKLEKNDWIVAVSEQNQQEYIAFDLKFGSVDCAKAPQALKTMPFCSPLE